MIGKKKNLGSRFYIAVMVASHGFIVIFERIENYEKMLLMIIIAVVYNHTKLKNVKYN